MHATTLLAVLNEPLAHALQAWSLIALPWVPTNCPAPQSVHGEHWLAGFSSWSQVRMLHVSGGVPLPAQYSPLSHATQTAGMVALPGTV